jgi:hypothetical protein
MIEHSARNFFISCKSEMTVRQEIARIIRGHDLRSCDEINLIRSERRSGYCGKRAAIAPILNKDTIGRCPAVRTLLAKSINIARRTVATSDIIKM